MLRWKTQSNEAKVTLHGRAWDLMFLMTLDLFFCLNLDTATALRPENNFRRLP